MSYFNYIESLFLISLGITFVLILFLIYHFKQRITSLEQKTETMFGIVNSIVKDMRTFVQSSFQQVPPIPTTNISLQQEIYIHNLIFILYYFFNFENCIIKNKYKLNNKTGIKISIRYRLPENIFIDKNILLIFLFII